MLKIIRESQLLRSGQYQTWFCSPIVYFDQERVRPVLFCDSELLVFKKFSFFLHLLFVYSFICFYYAQWDAVHATTPITKRIWLCPRVLPYFHFICCFVSEKKWESSYTKGSTCFVVLSRTMSRPFFVGKVYMNVDFPFSTSFATFLFVP